jgi:nucleoid DNA-binding protein
VNIVPLISNLLMRNARVVIPELGTFILYRRPAELSRVTGTLHPPSMQIAFNHLEQADDGTLVTLVSRRFRIKKEEAILTIRNFAGDIHSRLKKDGTVHLEGFGSLSLEKNGTSRFKADDTFLHASGIGSMPELTVPVLQDKPPLPKGPVAPLAELTRQKKNRLWIPASVAIVVVALIAGAYYTGLLEPLMRIAAKNAQTGSEEVKPDRLVFGSRDSVNGDSLRETVSQEIDRQTRREEALQIQPENLADKPVSTNNTAAPATAFEKPFHIIAGAFAVEANAERMKTRLEKKGFSAVILPQQGKFYMVSLGSYTTLEEASESLQQISLTLDQELWIRSK